MGLFTDILHKYSIVFLTTIIGCTGSMSLPASAQENRNFSSVFSVDTVFCVNDFFPLVDPDLYPLKTAVWKDELLWAYYTYREVPTDSVRFGFYNLQSNKISRQQLHVRGISEEINLFNYHIEDMACNEKYLCLLGFKRIYLFSRNKTGKLKFRGFDTLSRNYRKIFIRGDKAYLAECYPSSNKPSENDFEVMEYSISARRVLKRRNFDFKQLEFAYFGPSQWLCLVGKQLAVAEPHSYKIDFYDLNFKFQYSISRNLLGWKKMTLGEYDSLNKLNLPNNHNLAIKEMGNRLEKDLNWISYLSALGADTLVLDHYHTFNDHYVDVWVRAGESWKLLYQDLSDQYPKDTNLVYTPANFCIENRLNNYVSNEYYMISVQPGIPVLPFGFKPGQYLRLQNEYAEKSNFSYTFYVIKNKPMFR